VKVGVAELLGDTLGDDEKDGVGDKEPPGELVVDAVTVLDGEHVADADTVGDTVGDTDREGVRDTDADPDAVADPENCRQGKARTRTAWVRTGSTTGEERLAPVMRRTSITAHIPWLSWRR
jgi:hypothetical protein